MMRRLLALGLVVAVCAGSAVAASAVPASVPVNGQTQCQHPVTTGILVGYLKNISSAAACKIVLAWVKTQAYLRVVRCDGYKAVIVKHRWRIWTFTITIHDRQQLLTFNHGSQRFSTYGTDFPFYCD